MVYLAAVLVLLVLAGVAVFFYACAAPSAKIFRPVVAKGTGKGRRLVLSFDDGPSSPFTEQILDILRAKKVPATFFLCGKNVERYPDIVKRIVLEGHAVGNHTYSHPALCFRSSRRIAEEIDRTQAAIDRAAGPHARLFRPPFGIRWPGLMSVLSQRGMKLIMWSATGYDWKYCEDRIVQSALRELHPGAIILLHDGRTTLAPKQVDRSGTVKALPTIIDRALEDGYRFVPIEEFL
jgi:peptidoglycan-N-acetylglucosamine deacetylase